MRNCGRGFTNHQTTTPTRRNKAQKLKVLSILIKEAGHYFFGSDLLIFYLPLVLRGRCHAVTDEDYNRESRYLLLTIFAGEILLIGDHANPRPQFLIPHSSFLIYQVLLSGQYALRPSPFQNASGSAVHSHTECLPACRLCRPCLQCHQYPPQCPAQFRNILP